MLKKPNSIPTSPGVYKWLDQNNRVIYVGKANNLRNRLNNYFQPSERLHPRTANMVQSAYKLEWTIVQNETEALTLEYNWIKEFEPRFNVIFRFDDKSYPYLAISDGLYPRVFITRKRGNKKYKYFGPFPKAWAIKQTYNLLQDILKFRNCSSGVFNTAKRAKNPCLLGYINKCDAPCVGKMSSSDYQQKITELERFLKGDTKAVSSEIASQMEIFAKTEQFEQAAIRRDQLESIKVIKEHNSVQFSQTVNFDVFAISGDEFEVGVHIFQIRKGIIISENSYTIERGLDESEADIISDIILNTYQNNDVDIPKEICVSNLPDNYVILQSLLSDIHTNANDKTSSNNIQIHTVSRGAKRELINIATKNAEETLAKLRQNRRSDIVSRQLAIEEIQLALNMEIAPLRMECYDISHHQGQYQTGAMVVFEEGLPQKKDYRLFNVQEADDTAAIYEVLRRRLGYIGSDPSENELYEGETAKKPKRFAYTPQLLLIDGGLPQVNAASRAVKDANLQDKIAVASIAKRLEEIWLPNEEYPVILPRNSKAMYMLQYLRDEAHNFSIRSMRKRRKNATIKSKLDSVKGLGIQKQKLLLKEFGSVKQIILAAKDEKGRDKLHNIKGIDDKIICQLAEL